ncbi:signal peptidase I [Thermococcus piezophilus]|uniref:Signal peptidase I n=1 Tax=Thermococcus piezophilus TaxID=1712654 RepID=A0A172WGE4_9EURY|nr:signal peptidase I [Thermococcus piezophilus]ANF22491.1 signal peptidase I [Thermococcus piezophilus]
MNVKHRDILSILTYLLLFFVILVVVLKFIFGFQYVVILTDSMKPNINPNDLVVTYPSHNVHIGDIILYNIEIGNSTYRILHRVAEIRTDENGQIYYITKGDNRERPDPWVVYPDQVIGKPLIVIPKVGVIWYYTPFLVLALLLVVIASLAYDLAWAFLEEPSIRPKSKKADLMVTRRKKIKIHYYRRR